MDDLHSIEATRREFILTGFCGGGGRSCKDDNNYQLTASLTASKRIKLNYLRENGEEEIFMMAAL
jgi:hypothetical protein